jgi:cyclic pyranopterin monophosphate synthase
MLTHIDKNNNPTMVDVTDKNTSVRSATAVSKVLLPEIMRRYLNGDELVLKKGPVFHTAIIAGTMAVKKTHEIIPFCHQIPVESCKFDIKIADLEVTITCKIKTTFKTGVEMEALHGAMTAALTIYDMCKAVSHDIVIGETKLMSKTGGKRTILGRPVYGLVLTGGKSTRMKEDKALINYRGLPHAQYIHDVLAKFCDGVYLSARETQWQGTSLDKYEGPIGGMLSAFEKHPEANWIIVACDLIHFNETTVETLLANVSDKAVTAFKNREKGFPEPLCAFYSPLAYKLFKDAYQADIKCPVKVIKNADVQMIDQGGTVDLANINTPEERHEFNQH